MAIKRAFALFAVPLFVLLSIFVSHPTAVLGLDSQNPVSLPTLALVNGTLIDGTGAAPVTDAVLVIRAGQIAAVGTRATVKIPADATVIDVQGGTILPGFINAHVHDAFSVHNLETWAQAGVTTVRDEGLHTGTVEARINQRNNVFTGPQYARLVSAGSMITVPGGYGSAFVTSSEDAARLTTALIDAGVDQIKLSMEDGYAGARNLPKLSTEELAAIVQAAHKRNVPVSAHVTMRQYLEIVLDAGVDDAAHMICDSLTDALIERMIKEDIPFVPTLTVLEAYGCLAGASHNLHNFVAAGGKVALGNDYTDIPQNAFDHFELGMPMHEIERMADAGLTPMQIIVAATKNAAEVCRLGKDLGTLETGKIADVLVVSGDPLQELHTLTDVQLVIHDGVIIRQPGD